MFHPFRPRSSSDTLEATPQPLPFLITIRHRDVKAGGYFRPEAWVCFKAELRTSGFWQLLPAQEFRDWMLLLSFVTPNGDCGPTLEQLGRAMGVKRVEARRRMERLACVQWRGQPLLSVLRHEDGRVSYHPLPGLIPLEEEANEALLKQTSFHKPAISSRDQVIEHSRSTYGRPRAQVEREIAHVNDWPEALEDVAHLTKANDPPEETNQADVGEVPANEAPSEALQSARRQLLRIGVTREQVEYLLKKHDLLRIRRQLAWLSYREVRNRSGFIVAAIEDDYEAPPAVKRRLTRSQQDATAN